MKLKKNLLSQKSLTNSMYLQDHQCWEKKKAFKNVVESCELIMHTSGIGMNFSMCT